MARAKPGKSITKKYSKRVIFWSRLPFGTSWKDAIDREDIELLESINLE